MSLKTLNSWLKADLAGIAAGYLRRERFIPALLLVVAAMGVLIHRQTPWINGPEQWRWGYTPWRSFWWNWAVCMLRLLPWAAGLGALAWLIVPRLRGRARTVAAMAALVAWGMVYCWVSMGAISPFGVTHLARCVQSQGPTGFFHLAVRLDGPIKIDLLSLYPDYMNDMPLHPQTHPPGGTALCKWIIDLYDASPALVGATQKFMALFILDVNELLDDTLAHRMAAFGVGNLMLLLGMLTAWPLYLLVRDSMGGGLAGRRAGWAAAILWVHYPALMLFTPQFDEVYAFLVLSIAWILLRGLNGEGLARAAWHGAAAGAIFTAGFLLSFTFGVWVPLLLVMLLLECVRRAGSWRVDPASGDMRKLAWLIIAGVSTGIAILAVLQAALGMDIIPIFSRAFELNHRFRLRAERTYWPWLFFGPWDAVMVAGPALFIPAAVFALRAVRRGLRRPDRIMSAWVMGPLGVVMMTVSGLMPGENARLYLMFTPSLAWAGAVWLTMHSRRRFWANFALILLGQIVYFYILRTKIKFIDM